MAELFQTSKQDVAKHLKAVFTEGGAAARGKNYRVAYYSLEAILAVGYRVRSPRGTQFRRWATERLAEYLVSAISFSVCPSRGMESKYPAIRHRTWTYQ